MQTITQVPAMILQGIFVNPCAFAPPREVITGCRQVFTMAEVNVSVV